MPWQSGVSDRTLQLPADWPRRRATVIARDPVCQCQGCDRCNGLPCTRRSTDADHKQPGEDHSLANLAGKCRDCHALKSSEEGHEAMRRIREQSQRPVERHPGLI